VHIIPFSIVLGIHQATSAGILAVIGGISILGGFCSGALTDRIGVKKSLTVFLMIALCSLIWLVFSQEIWQLYLFAVIFGLGYGSIGVAETIISVWLFGLKANALILSIIDLGLTLGAASGPLIAGRIFDITESYRTAFILTAVMSLSGLLLTLFLKPLKTSAVSKPIGE
jgi:MFS family permease